MLRRPPVLGSILSLLTFAHVGFTQLGPVGQTMGPEFNIYNADHVPENDPEIARLISEMSVEEATAILQRELVAAQFFGLDGVIAEHWGSTGTNPEAAATQTLVVDPLGLSWRSMAQHQEEVAASFSYAEAVQVWTRFSMAEQVSNSDPPAVSPQGVVLYLLTDEGVFDVMDHAIALSKILPSYPGGLPTYPSGQSLTEPGLFVADGSPRGFAVCCFSSTGFGLEGDPHIPLERLPLVIAAFQRLAPDLEVPETRLLLMVPMAEPSAEETETILAFCNREGFDNQGVFLCQHNQLIGLAYMKIHVGGEDQELLDLCSAAWVGDYRLQAECVIATMME